MVYSAFDGPSPTVRPSKCYASDFVEKTPEKIFSRFRHLSRSIGLQAKFFGCPASLPRPPRNYRQLAIAGFTLRIERLVKAEAHALFRRVVFNVLISNVDDHLRNHGFLWLGKAGWLLSPAYDLNPVPTDLKARVLTTNIDLDEGAPVRSIC